MAEYTERQAQVAVDQGKHLNIKLVQTFETNSNWICGCDITTDGKILLTDYSHKKCLIGIDTDGNHLFTISTAPYDAFDVTCINDTTVAVTSGTYKVISLVDISSRAVKKHINIGYNCYGVTQRDGTLLVCAQRHGILSINLTNEKITTIVQCDILPWCSYVTTYRDKLYYTNCQSLTCCYMEGNTFKDSKSYYLTSPRGITTDNAGRVYVCVDVDNNVLILSIDQTETKTIMSISKGLSTPYAIHFDKKRNNLLTTNQSKRVSLFHVSS